MLKNYIINVGNEFYPELGAPVKSSLFQQYERVLIESLITSFGLDFLIRDQYGGDVDTIYTVRQVGKNAQMTYKNKINQNAYENRGVYDSHEYHSDARYIAKNREVYIQKKTGTLLDSYTGDKIAPNGKSDLDHVIAAKEIHEDPGRVLAGLKGTDLANCNENLHATNPHTNRTKKADSMEVFLDKYGNEYTEKQKDNMRNRDIVARKSYEIKLAGAYYTSAQFKRDLAFAAGNVGVRMGVRQAVGFVFAEMWFAVRDEFQENASKEKFELGKFFHALAYGIKKGYENAKRNYPDLFSRFLSGATAGVLASVTTTLCNIFFAAAKNVVRIIRQSYASLVEAAKVLFINPENYTFGERMRETAKVLAMGASVVTGTMISDAIEKMPVRGIPVIGDILPTWCGIFVTGIMSCTMLYLLDSNEKINQLIQTLDRFHTVETEIDYYRRQADYFEKYAAQFMGIDINEFQNEIALYHSVMVHLENAKTEDELTGILKEAFDAIEVVIPWKEHKSFDDFMENETSHLVFE